MKISCDFECKDVEIIKYIQNINFNPDNIKMILISEALTSDIKNYFDGPNIPQFIQTTNIAYNDAGFVFKNYTEYLNYGIYLTTALKCQKKDYLVSSETIKNCSFVLENELNKFKNIKVIMLMGDFAIKSVNYIWKRKFSKKIIPEGSTYKIRKGIYEDQGIRFFPSYTQTGDSFNIEKTKHKMISEDIKLAMEFLN